MLILIQTPSPDSIKTWGPLAYVTDEERRRIMSLPPVESKFAVKQLEREISAMLKQRRGRV